ncbi:type III secretion protein [Caballeronia sp. LZ035]|uniref:type III secretion protein n=1 Tax=Caballeronia sp. LZ035 TaxID=3038568 RepID=UPI00285727D1|nr:type III secretion protein [Caballeronia sp. LZ035]MDR5759456.1 type III secretion protein [Caballeronia sp. LZ035]
MEADLRASLDALRRDLAQLQAHAEELKARVDELEATAFDHRSRIARMMTGEDTFSLDTFEACRRYLDIIDARTREAGNALDAQQAAIVAKQAETQLAQRAIAVNRARIDLCRKRVRGLEQVLEQAALDAEDEAAEERVMAKRLAMKA